MPLNNSWPLVSLPDVNPAGLVSGDRPGWDAATGKFTMRKSDGVFNVRDYGATGDGVTDDAAAITLAGAALQTAGGGTLYFPRGTYFIDPAASATVCAWTGLNGVMVDGANARIINSHQWTPGQLFTMFRFTTCLNITVDLDYSGYIPGTLPANGGQQGAILVVLYTQCEHVDLRIKARGAYYGVYAGSYLAPALGGNFDIRAQIDAYVVGYPWASWAAKGLDLQITSRHSHRALYLAATSNARAKVSTQDHQAPIACLLTSDQIAAGIYDGCHNIVLNATDTGSTVQGQDAGGATTFLTGLSTVTNDVVTHSDIDMHVSMVGTATKCLKMGGVIIGGLGGYAHTFRNVLLSGEVDCSAQPIADHRSEFAIFAGVADSCIFSNFAIRNFTTRLPSGSESSAGTAVIHLHRLLDIATIENYTRPSGFVDLVGNTTSKITMINCKARGFSASSADTSYVDLYSCLIAVSSAQSFVNKRFICCNIAGVQQPSIGTTNAVTAGTNEIQTITIDAAGGHWHAIFGGQTTGVLDWNITAAALQTAFCALSSVGAGRATVAGGPGATAGLVVTFVGALGSTDVGAITTDATALTGGAGTATVVTTLAGAAAVTGPCVKKMEVFDAAGVSIGYVPLYDAIT